MQRPAFLLAFLSGFLLITIASAQHPFAPSALVPSGVAAGSTVAFDVDGDGDLDLASVGAAPTLSMLTQQTGLWAAPVHLALGTACDRLRAGDLNGDGQPELTARALVAGSSTGLQIVANMGPAGLGGAGLQTLGSGLLAYELADWDGDGDLDIVALLTQGGAGGSFVLAANNGAGAFAAAVPLLPGGWAPFGEFGVFDADNDGDLDAFLLPQTGSQALVWHNDGTGAMAGVALVSLDPSVFAANRVVLGDLDGDGLEDALVGHPFPNGGGLGSLRLHRNLGGGALGGAEAVSNPGGLAPRAMALLDADGDGDRDLVILTELMGALQLSWNDGSGAFPGAVSLSTVASNATALVAADLDNDGDPDLVRTLDASASSGHELLHNLRPRLSLLSAPAVGSTVSLRVSSPRDGLQPYMCGFSTLYDPGLPLPDGRKVPLFPDSLFSFCFTAGNGVFLNNVGSLDALGAATVQFLVPADPALVGWTLHAGMVTLLPGAGLGVGNVSGDPVSITLQ